MVVNKPKAGEREVTTRNRGRQLMMFSYGVTRWYDRCRPHAVAGSGGSMRLHGKAWKNLLSDQIDRASNLVMGGVSGLQHEDHLVETGFLPLLDLAADRVADFRRSPCRRRAAGRSSGRGISPQPLPCRPRSRTGHCSARRHCRRCTSAPPRRRHPCRCDRLRDNTRARTRRRSHSLSCRQSSSGRRSVSSRDRSGSPTGSRRYYCA